MPPDLAIACSFAADEVILTPELGRDLVGSLSPPYSCIFEWLSHSATAIETLQWAVWREPTLL
jgi:hypothetical protein